MSAGKRIFDVIVSLAVLFVLSPVLAVCAIAVALESPGGIVFRQERIGLDGKPFHIRKFRTMRADNDGSLVTVDGDNRITRVGSVLRLSKLDELPQLLNVVEGTMSLVGPRPEVPHYVAQWPADLRPVVLSVRPGITDPMSVRLRHEAQMLAEQDDPETFYVTELLPQKAAGYADYVRRQSMLGDLQIIAQTLLVVVGWVPRGERAEALARQERETRAIESGATAARDRSDEAAA